MGFRDALQEAQSEGQLEWLKKTRRRHGRKRRIAGSSALVAAMALGSFLAWGRCGTAVATPSVESSMMQEIRDGGLRLPRGSPELQALAMQAMELVQPDSDAPGVVIHALRAVGRSELPARAAWIRRGLDHEGAAVQRSAALWYQHADPAWEQDPELAPRIRDLMQEDG